MAITFDSAGSASVASGQTISWAHTVTGANPVLIVGLNIKTSNGTFTDSVKYAGQNMTRINTTSASVNSSSLYYLAAPPTGLGTISGTTPSTASELTGFSMSFKGVDQTANAIFGSSSGNQNIVGSAHQIRNLLNGAVYTGICAINTSPGTTATANGQTEAGQVTGGTQLLMATYETPTTVNKGTADWTFPSGTQSYVLAELRIGGGSIAFDATGTFGQTSGSTYSFAHTVTGANTLLTLQVSNAVAGSTVSVKFGGQAMTRLLTGTNTNVFEMFYLVNPPTGLGTFNGTLDQTNIFSTVAVSNSYTGVNQSTPIQGSAVAFGTIVSSGSVLRTTTTDSSWLVGGLALTSVVAGTTDTTIGAVERGTATATGVEVRSLSSGPFSPTAPGTLRWTSAASTYLMQVAEINPAPLASNAGPTFIGYKSQLGVGY